MKNNIAWQHKHRERLLVLLLGLSFLSFTQSEDPSISQEADTENVLILDIEATVRMVLNHSDKLFAAKCGIRSAELNIESSLSEFDFNMIPNGKSGYIGGGTAGSGLSIGGGLSLEKKTTAGTQISMAPSLLKDAKKFKSIWEMRVSQPLLKGFGKEYNLSGIKRAEFGHRTAIRTFYKNMSATILRSIELLYEIAKYEEIVKLNYESYKRFEMFWRASKIKIRIGLSNALDVYRAEIELKQAEESLNQSKETLQDAKDSIRDLLSLPQDAKFTVKVPLEMAEDNWNLEELIETALLNRIEVEQGMDQLEENQRLANIAKTDLLPELNLVVDYSNIGYGEQFTGSFGRKRESRWGIGFTTSTDTVKTHEKTAYENALIAVKLAKNANLEIEKSIALDVQRTLRALHYAREKIALQKEQIKNTRGGLKLAKIKFLREFATNFDVIQAEKAFHAAQTNLISAFVDHKISEFRLRAAMGLLMQVASSARIEMGPQPHFNPCGTSK